jgi:hypothetical protein
VRGARWFLKLRVRFHLKHIHTQNAMGYVLCGCSCSIAPFHSWRVGVSVSAYPYPLLIANSCTANSIRVGRIPWPPREISGEEAQARSRFSGLNEGATKCTGARARPEPCAAKPEPPDHRARGSHESGSQSRFPIPAKATGGLCQFA